MKNWFSNSSLPFEGNIHLSMAEKEGKSVERLKLQHRFEKLVFNLRFSASLCLQGRRIMYSKRGTKVVFRVRRMVYSVRMPLAKAKAIKQIVLQKGTKIISIWLPLFQRFQLEGEGDIGSRVHHCVIVYVCVREESVTSVYVYTIQTKSGPV